MIHVPEPQQKYRDKDGRVYVTKGEATHSETQERFVLLQEICGDHLGMLYAMPYDRFYDGEPEKRGRVAILHTTMERL